MKRAKTVPGAPGFLPKEVYFLSRLFQHIRRLHAAVSGVSIPVLIGAALLFGLEISPALHALNEWDRTERDLRPPSIWELSIEDLAHIEVISLAGRPREIHSSAAAVHVITGDDIRRSGATSIPEALRLAPGVHVGRVDSHQWAVSTRGFSNLFANKQLVMIDGRSIYTPLFSGVYWDMHDTFIEDIDRIEVIRGPGGSLWGANAVNGVINVVTKNARDTQGSLMYAGSGTHEQGFAGARHGGEIGDDGYFRVYAKHFDRDSLRTPDGDDANDRWYVRRGGFRTDFEPSGPGKLTVQGDIYEGTINNTLRRVDPDPPHEGFLQDTVTNINGGNLLGRVTHDGLGDSEARFQAYYDYNVRDSDILREERRTLDGDFQYGTLIEEGHYLMWGAGYRMTLDQFDNSFDVTLDPDRRRDHLFSTFIQNEFELVEDVVSWTVGSKFEHNDYTGFEFQPSTRLLWVPRPRNAVWASVSRAVRTPSRADHDVILNQEDPETGSLVTFFGQRNFQSENLIAYELGYRTQPGDRLRFDVSLFFNNYNDIRTREPRGDPDVSPIELEARNKLSGETYGGEAAVTWYPLDSWRWYFGYGLLRMHLRTDDDSLDTTTAGRIEGSSPRHQVSVRTAINLSDGWEFDTGARYVDNLSALGVDSYTQMDARLAWRPRNMGVEFSVVGQNLLRSQHTEFSTFPSSSQGSDAERGVYGKLTWQF